MQMYSCPILLTTSMASEYVLGMDDNGISFTKALKQFCVNFKAGPFPSND
jgi:hypothetical protein